MTAEQPAHIEQITCEHCKHKWELEAKPFEMPNRGENDGEWFSAVGVCPQCHKPVIHIIHKFTLKSKAKRKRKSGQPSEDGSAPDGDINMIVEMPF